MDVEIDGFEIDREIGRGGFGVVYRARQTSLGRLAAVKVLLPHSAPADIERRFAQECRAIGSLAPHPNIVTVYSTGTAEDGAPYLAMQYLGGGSLADRVPLSAGTVAALGARLADGLRVAHTGGVIHRDVKPSNVLFDDDAEPKLVDFGISSMVGDATPAAGDITVSVAYAAPEILRGQPATVAADVYGLGATLFAAVSGRTPFAGSPASADKQVALRALAERVLREPVEDLRRAGVPDALCSVIERCMAKDAGARFASMAEVRAALLPIEGDALSRTPAQLWGMPTGSLGKALPAATALPVATPAGPSRSRSALAKHRRVAFAAAAAVLLGGGIATAALAGGGSGAPSSRHTIAGSGAPDDLTGNGSQAAEIGQGSSPIAAGSTAGRSTVDSGSGAGRFTSAPAVPSHATTATAPITAPTTTPSSARTRPGAPAPSSVQPTSAPTSTHAPTASASTPPPNHAPTLKALPPLSTSEGKAVSLNFSASDPDGNPIAFSVTGLPGGLTMSSAGAVRGAPGRSSVHTTTNYKHPTTGRFHVTVTVRDSHGATASRSVTWSIRDTEFYMHNYINHRGCNGVGSCHESVPNIDTLGPHNTRCVVNARKNGLIVKQSVAGGDTGRWGQTFTFVFARKSC